MRPYDSVGRYGGEEFLIFAPDCGIDETVSIAERLRVALSAAAMKLSSGPIHMTASFGLSATLPCANHDMRSLIEAADRALYRAKNLGRNRVEWFHDVDLGKTISASPIRNY
jgi:diguanylate cyclase (GGDEF)-like protein